MINYTYTVKLVNNDIKMMDVEYTAEGHDPITVGMSLPIVGTDLNTYIRSMAPIGQWTITTKEYEDVSVGTTGTGQFDDTTTTNAATDGSVPGSLTPSPEFIKMVTDIVKSVVTTPAQ